MTSVLYSKDLPVPIEDWQKDCIPTMRWLASIANTSRCTGRTRLILLAIIEEAIKNPGAPIHVFDHAGSIMRVHTHNDMLWGLAAEAKLNPDDFTIGFNPHRVTYHGPAKKGI